MVLQLAVPRCSLLQYLYMYQKVKTPSEKSMIAVGNIVIAFGHGRIIVQLNVCEFCSNFHLKIIRNNIIIKVSEKCDYIIVITQRIKNVITNNNSAVVSCPDPFQRD